MMLRRTSLDKPRWQRLQSWIALALLLGLSIGAFIFFFFLRDRKTVDDGPGKVNAKGARTAAPYANRAVGRGRDGKPGQPIESPVITGHVYSTAGAVVEGAKIAATTFEVAGNLPAVARTTTTDANGFFTLPLPEGTYHIQGNKPGFGPSYVPARTGEEVSLFMSKSGALKGRVTDGRRPVERYSIEILSPVPDSFAAPAPLYSQRIESRDGTFTIDEMPAFPIILRASAEGRAPVFSPLLRVDPDDSKEIELVMSDGCTLTGKVKDENGQPIAGVFVDAESKMTAGQMNEVSMEAARQATSGDDGAFRIDNVPSGPVLVRGYDGSHAVSTTLVKVAECDKLEPVSLTMSEGGVLTGVARASDGAPLANAKVMLTQRALGFVNTTTDAEGRYRFESVPAGRVRVDLTHEGQWASISMKVEEASVVERDIALNPSGNGEVSGRVVANGKPLPGVKLLVAATHGREKGFDLRYATTNQDGAYRADGLAPGHYIVRVMSAGTLGGIDIDEAHTQATLDLDVAAPRPKPENPRAEIPKQENQNP